MALDIEWTYPTEQEQVVSSVTRQNEDVLQNILYLRNWLHPFAALGLTIDNGEITISQAFHSIIVEGGTGSGADDLDTISGGEEGMIIILHAATTGENDTVTIKHDIDNIQCALATDFVMDSANDIWVAIFDGTNWLEISRSSNTA